MLSVSKNLKLIEDFDFNKYRIDNKDTATALYVADSDFGERLVEQVFIVNNGNGVFRLYYSNEPAIFDSPQSQDIMNKIINSFKIIN